MGRAGSAARDAAVARRPFWIFVGVTIALTVVANPTFGASPTECDRLVGSPDDTQRVGPGVAFALIVAAPAIATCQKDLQADPSQPRLQFNLGRALEKAQQIPAAAELFKSAAAQGYSAAQSELALYLWWGFGGTRKDPAEAIRLLDLAIKSGDPNAKARREGFFERAMKTSPRDPETARIVQAAADRGDPDALYWEAATAGPADQAEAVRMLRKSSELGNPKATFALGLKYYSGEGGLPKDAAETQRLLDSAAASGDASLETLVGIAYETGNFGMPQDDAIAAKLYRSASGKGWFAAEYQLGRFYEQGRGGLAKNGREAARLWALAAEQGDPNAAFALGLYRLSGLGEEPKDEAEGIRLIKQAADRGLSKAKEQLAKMGISK
jgi:uncharacterized protein